MLVVEATTVVETIRGEKAEAKVEARLRAAFREVGHGVTMRVSARCTQ